MAKHFGDYPCVKLAGIVHLTVSGTHCACGGTYNYRTPDRYGRTVNIIWRDQTAITCSKCLSKLEIISSMNLSEFNDSKP